MFSRLKAACEDPGTPPHERRGDRARIGPVDANVLDQLEEALILADVGGNFRGICRRAARGVRRGELPDTDALRARLRAMVTDTLAPRMIPLKWFRRTRSSSSSSGERRWKTTTIGKVASGLRRRGAPSSRGGGHLSGRGDRAARRVGFAGGADIVRHKEGADSSAVAFDAVRAAKARGSTSSRRHRGRLHTKSHLMEEVRRSSG